MNTNTKDLPAGHGVPGRPIVRPVRRRLGLMMSLTSLGLVGLLSPCPSAANTPAAPAAPALQTERVWQFQVLLDERQIGEHRFTLRERGDERVLHSDARFDVKLLGLTLYRYRHEATERWRGDCLDAVQARTDDNGTATTVEARRDGERLRVDAPAGERVLDGCVMSFAYWHPAMRRQTQLLNVQTGELEPVRVRRAGEAPWAAATGPVTAERWVIEGLPRPLSLWVSTQGEWLGLESVVAGGKRLRYRLM